MSTEKPSDDPESEKRPAPRTGEPVEDTKSADTPRPPPRWTSPIEGYEIIRELGRAGQGVVYQAVQLATKRKVAIKLLKAGQYAPAAAKRRFDREIKAIARLNHPNIISIFDAGIANDGSQFYVMDYVRGLPLHRYVRKNGLSLEDTLRLFAEVCKGVQCAHEHGIIHRDLKPSNILVDPQGTPKILDFGLAKQLAQPLDTVVSITSDFMGTLPYMSPEQAQGDPGQIDARADVYSLGVILYELLTGHFPYTVTGHVAEMLKQVAESPPTPPTRKWTRDSGVVKSRFRELGKDECPIDDEVETIVLKTLSKEPSRRYQSAEELARDIEYYLKGEPIEARRDSVPYVLWTRSRLLAQRHRIALFLGIIIVSTFLARAAGVPLISRWTPANELFHRFVIGGVNISGSPPPFKDVRVIALTDETDLEVLAHKEGIEGMDFNDPKSLRSLHGRLMEKLAASRCRTVAWASCFCGGTDFDEEFVRGVEALSAVGRDVVVGVPSWRMSKRGLPELTELSPTIAPKVRWGCVIGEFGEEVPWSVPLVGQRGSDHPLPSLALEAFVSFQHPRKSVGFRLDTRREYVDVLYHLQGTDDSTLTAPLYNASRIPLGGGIDSESGWLWGPQFDPKVDSLVGKYHFVVPPDGVLDSATVEYGRVFSADEGRLRQWFDNKVIVVGDFRSSRIYRFKHPDGRRLPGCYGYAAAVDALLRRIYLQVPASAVSEWVFPVSAVLVGCVMALLAGRSYGRRVLALAAWTAALFGASIIAYWKFQYFFNPLLPIAALWIAGEVSAAVHRAFIIRRSGLS